MNIYTLDMIKSRINIDNIIAQQEAGFIAYSAGQVTVPPVGYLPQQTPQGSYHIKYGLLDHDDVWVMKVAGGPNEQPLQGMMLVFSTATGAPIALLQDNGYLTQYRTAIAGLIAAKTLAAETIHRIGIIGSGEQAEWQLKMLKHGIDCRRVMLWGRNQERCEQIKQKFAHDFEISIAPSTQALAQQCNLIVTTTSAREPLLMSADIQPGTHITAVGADAPGKFELDAAIFSKADIVCVDSKQQCCDHGEIYQAYQQGSIEDGKLVEIGEILANPRLGRTNNEQITLTDLTGVAIQDIQIAKSIISA